MPLFTLKKKVTGIIQAKQAIDEDNAQILKQTLLSFSNSITEDTYIDENSQHNLLHYASFKLAEKCIELLVNPPFSWDPDRKNKNNLTPLQISMKETCLSTWYTLASKSLNLICSGRVQANRSITAFLIHPQTFIGSSFFSFEVLGATSTHFVPGICAEYFRNGDQQDYNLCLQNYLLLFELLLATPECNLKFEEFKSSKHFVQIGRLQLPTINMKLHHNPQCQSYPVCILDVMISYLSNEKLFDECWIEMFYVWAFHRMGLKLTTDEVEQEVMQVSCNLKSNILKLSDWCRVAVRQFGARQRAMNYAAFITGLNLPNHLKKFLSYNDLWPSKEINIIPPQWFVGKNLPNHRYMTMYERWQSDEDSCRQS